MKQKEKSGERLGFLTYLGATLMNFSNSFGEGLMTSWFLLYLTDYAGIGSWGALLGSALLMFARLFDAFNDPIEGWIMDRAKVGKHGKYKPFILLSIVMLTVGVICLFFLPSSLSDSPVLICIWVILGYLIYDIGYSFFAPNLVYRTLTLDSSQRGKLMIAPRIFTMIIGMITGSLISIVNGINASVGNMHTAFGVTVMIFMVSSGVLSILGALLLKEKYHTETEKSERIHVTDIFKLFKENDALRTNFLQKLFSGFTWTLLFAAATYYIKWAYCADLTTGAVDTETFGTLSLIASMMQMFPLILGTVIAVPLMKLFKTPMRTYRFVIAMEAFACGALFVLQLLGVLTSSPYIFLGCVAICATAIGIGYIPLEAANIECMDYEIYKNGKDRSALCNAADKFVNKLQTAFSTGIVGILLTAIGYEVDSVTGDYVGELSAIPGMLTGFIIIIGLIPFVLDVIALLITRMYPITEKVAAEMKEALGKN